jgi:outer membrane immunogenic protein
MMRILIAAPVLLAGMTLARAADLPSASRLPQVTAFNWTGCYIGGNLGGNFVNATDRLTVAAVQTANGTTTFGGGVGGGQGGCNYQLGNLVYSVEADAQVHFPTQFGTAITPLGAVTNAFPVFGTVRGRIGYTLMDRVMFYVTGGGGVGLNVIALTQGTQANPITQTSMRTRALWTIGAGVEASLYANWTVKVEYLYLNAGTTTANFNIGGIPSTVSTRLNDNLIRVGVNYHF